MVTLKVDSTGPKPVIVVVLSSIMSWITNMEAKPDPNFKDDGPKVPDPAIPDRMVSTKRANRPFLA